MATVPITSSPSADTRRSPESVIAWGALLRAAVSTAALFLKVIFPVPPAFCVSAASLTWSWRTCIVEKIFFVASASKSVTVAILSFTFLIASVVSSARAFMVAASMPSSAAALEVASVLISAKSAAFVKSISLSAAAAFGSSIFSAFVFTTSTTEPKAAVNASPAPAPAPSAAEAKEVTAVMICWLTFSTSRAAATAAASFSSTSNGLKVRGSIPSGRPRTAATSSAEIPPSSIKVVVGVMTPAPEGAVKVMPERAAPEDVSTV